MVAILIPAYTNTNTNLSVVKHLNALYKRAFKATRNYVDANRSILCKCQSDARIREEEEDNTPSFLMKVSLSRLYTNSQRNETKQCNVQLI